MSEWGVYGDWLYKGLKLLSLPDEALEERVQLKGYTQKPSFIPMEDYLQLMSWAADRLGKKHLGLELALALSVNPDPSDFGINGFLNKNSATVGDAWEMTERYQSILMRGMFADLHKHGDSAELRYQILQPFCEGVRHDVEFMSALGVSQFRSELKIDWFPDRVNFIHSMNWPSKLYNEVLGPNVHFNQPYNSVIFPTQILDLPINDSDPKLLNLLKQQAELLLDEIKNNDDFVKQVRLLVMTSLGNETFDLNLLCKELNITTRTLHRRLKKYKLTYSEIKEDIIAALAKEALIKTDVSISQIALSLGYNESSSFIRAFKRMSGISPLQYRNEKGYR